MSRILFLEDDPDVGPLLAAALVDAGHDVEPATSARKAAQLLDRNAYDLVLADAVLPDGDGLAIADMAERRGSRVLVLTGHVRRLPMGQLFRHKYLAKPVRLSILLDTIARQLVGDERQKPSAAAPNSAHVSGLSRFAATGRRVWRKLYKPDIRENPETRAALVRVAEVEQRKSNEMLGAELGYRYVDSPIISNIPNGPEHRFIEYTPTTWPGARLPHLWLDDGTPIQDRIGGGFTILRLGRSATDMRPLGKALAAFGAPVQVLDLPDKVARDVYGYDLLLLRPDLHIVWRDNKPPENAGALAALATGHHRPPARDDESALRDRGAA